MAWTRWMEGSVSMLNSKLKLWVGSTSGNQLSNPCWHSAWQWHVPCYTHWNEASKRMLKISWWYFLLSWPMPLNHVQIFYLFKNANWSLCVLHSTRHCKVKVHITHVRILLKAGYRIQQSSRRGSELLGTVYCFRNKEGADGFVYS